jgi:hypothetical protein
MGNDKKTIIWTLLALGILGAVLTIVLVRRRHPIILRGTVLRQDSDPH